MAASAIPTLLTMEEYLRTSYTPDCDFVDGVLEERNVGEYPHSKLQARIVGWFLRHEQEWAIDPLTEQRIRVSQTRTRICDVSLLRADAPREDVTVTPPLACIELLSPEDRVPRAVVVLADYWRMGVRTLWLIDPLNRIAYRYDETGLHLTNPERLEIAGTPIYIPLGDLFKTLD